MNIFVYSDESGVFDKNHNDIYVFGGVIFLDKESRDICTRKYIHAENVIRLHNKYPKDYELKACKITNGEKDKLYRSLNNYIKFGVVIDQKKVLQPIFESKKDKQRYLDYAYKIALKRAFEQLIREGKIPPQEKHRLYVFIDEHTTATNGKYELEEALEQEFKHGTYNFNYSKYHPPIFSNLLSVELTFCNSASKTLIRSADIIANRLYYKATHNDIESLISNKFLLQKLPY